MIKKILLGIALSCSVVLAAPGAALIEVETIKKGVVNPLQKFVGTVNFDKKSTLASQSSGLIKKVNFEVGDKVKKGKVLVEIDSDLLDARIKSYAANLQIAKIQSENAKKDYNRYKRLLETKSITTQEFDTSMLEFNSAEQNVISLKAQLKELKIQKAQKVVSSPYNAVVVEKVIHIGEWASEGKNMAMIVDTSSIEIIFNLPANLISALNDKKIYEINIANKVLKTKFHSIIPKGDKLTRTFPVKFKANVKDMFVFDGQEASVKLAKQAKMQSLIINRDAVIKRFGSEVIFVNNKGVALMIPVKILGFLGKDVAISGEGLVEGMSVVVKGNERVFPNQAVKVINK